MTDVLQVLHVCTANLCRSPIAEHLMRRGLEDRLGPHAGSVVVASAGTWGHTGAGMHPATRVSLSHFGVDSSTFRTRELLAEQVSAADLVLTATRKHRAAAVVLHPRAAVRTFTLLEFERLCQGVQEHGLPHGGLVERGRALVAAARAQRGVSAPGVPGDDDLADPYGRSSAAFTACAHRVRLALHRPLDLLAGTGRPARGW